MSSEQAPKFWMTGPLTGGELRIADSPGELLFSLLAGYGVLPLIPASEGEAPSRYREWLEIRLHDRYHFACEIATEYQARALAAAAKAGTWSLEAETDANIDRLYSARHFVPDSSPWPAGSVRLVVVHPVLEELDWEPPAASRSLVVIDPRTEVDLLRGLTACGALDSAGRLDLRSRFKHPLGL
ncbi:hypothetical protein [Cryobacterium sp. SO1]|uniref:hypothetical protein n=1 Tax=Cryobacterium sp. SO1 TaxID=1897061 RepID=UPI0010238A71|nr:hypothetical protein [Cryobacterium sp. SO1]